MVKASNNKLNPLFLLIVLGWLILCFYTMWGCSHAKKTQKAYTFIGTHPPLTVKDSGNLSSRSNKTFPVKKDTIVKHGKTIVRTKKVEDTAKVNKLHRAIDSLIGENDFTMELINSMKNPDSLESVVANLRYKLKVLTNDCGGLIHTDSLRIDTLESQRQEDVLLIGRLNYENNLLTNENIRLKEQASIYKKQSKERLWLIIGLLAIIVGYGLSKLKFTLPVK